jgi:hypothetical protein
LPWLQNYTYRCALAIVTIFVFLRIYTILKMVLAMLCLLGYGLIIAGLMGEEKVKIFFSVSS